MNAFPFDTLKLAKDLEKTGWNYDQASEAARALADCMFPALATKTDKTALEDKTAVGLAKMEARMATEVASLQTEFARVRTEPGEFGPKSSTFAATLPSGSSARFS